MLQVKYSSNKNNIDYSYLIDGLLSEREQKITIDVAYRYFETGKESLFLQILLDMNNIQEI